MCLLKMIENKVTGEEDLGSGIVMCHFSLVPSGQYLTEGNDFALYPGKHICFEYF